MQRKKGENISHEAATKPKTECRILSTYFFCKVIVIAEDNRHFVIVLSENRKMLSTKVRNPLLLPRYVGAITASWKTAYSLNDFVTTQKQFLLWSAVSQSKIKGNGNSCCDNSYLRRKSSGSQLVQAIHCFSKL